MAVARPGYPDSVPDARRRLARAWRALERFAERPLAAPLAFAAAALAVYAAVSFALPLAPGRDLSRYLLVYLQLFEGHVPYPHALSSRTPGTPLVVGPLLDGGPVVAEAGAAFLYAGSMLAWCAVARRFGPAAAIATAVALLLYPGYVILFHRLSSDAVFAAAFAGTAWLVARAVERPSLERVAALGAGVAGLVYVRPVAQVLLLLVLVPLVAGRTWRARVQGSAAFVLAAAVPLLALVVHNGVRADDYAVVRGGGASIPFFRAFVTDRIVEPENGPASRELADAVSRDLLPEEPYRSYEIDLDRFFSSGSARMHDDLIGLADRTWGWDDDYAHLARVGREAVREHPGAYARGVAADLRDVLFWPLYVELPEGQASPAPTSTVLVAERQLPAPSEGEPIPGARQSSYLSTPDNRIREVWTSATEHRTAFDDPRDQARVIEIDLRLGELGRGFPDRDPRPELVDRLNSASRWYPRPIMWLGVGVVAVLVRRRRWLVTPLVLAGAGLLILFGTSLAVYALAEYSVPVAPAFVLLATVGVLGRAPSPTPV
jgi:Dolichyl-phosphate-mannose-protein mannosyltransferase